MPIMFFIPGPLRELAGGRREVRIDEGARSLAEALARLWVACPAVRDRVITERGELRPHINIFVDGENIRYSGGLDTSVRDGSEIMVLPAISGG